METSNVLSQAIGQIFVQSDQALAQNKLQLKSKSSVKRSELELALSVILVDLASCDQKFDSEEFQAVSRGLRRIFGTQKTDVVALVQRAQSVIDNLRGTANFAKLLRQHLSQKDRDLIAEIIEEVIAADGVEDGFETYLRSKYFELLGIPLPEKKKEELDSGSN
jgi:uncharacterized tellurite resistance protein B-like protein